MHNPRKQTNLPKKYKPLGLRAGYGKNFMLLSLVLFLSFVARAQSLPTVFWEKSFGGSKSDELTFLEQTSDGSYLAGGFTDSGQSKDKASAGHGLSDFWVLKLDSNGSLVWEKTFGSNDQDICNVMVQTPDGGCILGGSSRSGRNEHKSQPSAGNYDYWIVRLDANGNKLWDKTYGGTNYDFLYSLQLTPDGGILLGGYSDSGIGGSKTNTLNQPEYWVLKLDNKGNKLWDKPFGKASSDGVYTMKQAANGSIFLGSGVSRNLLATGNGKNGNHKYQVAHFDSNGSLLWEKSISGTGGDYLSALEPAEDGGCLIGGVSLSGRSGDKSDDSQGKGDVWLVKLDAAGQKKWDRTYGGKNLDFLSVIAPTSDGGFILGGNSASPKGSFKTHDNKGKTDFWLIKTDANGNKLWDETYGAAGEDILYALQQTSDGGYIIGGVSDSPVSGHKNTKPLGDKDFWIMKLNVLEPSWNSR